MQNKFEDLYPKIDLGFLSMSQANKDKTCSDIFSDHNIPLSKGIPYLPTFSVHRLTKDSNGFYFADCDIFVSTVGNVRDEFEVSGVELKNLPLHVLKSMTPVFCKRKIPSHKIHDVQGAYWKSDPPKISGRSWYNERTRYTHSFKGLLPSTTKKKIDECLGNFQQKEGIFDIYLINECTDWQAELLTTDPLIIGIVAEQAYLIDHFDCTDIEAYARKEFTS